MCFALGREKCRGIAKPSPKHAERNLRGTEGEHSRKKGFLKGCLRFPYTLWCPYPLSPGRKPSFLFTAGYARVLAEPTTLLHPKEKDNRATMKFGVALATLGLVAQGSAFVPSFNARQSFVGQTVAHAAAPASTRQTRQVLNMVAAAPAVDTEVLTRVSARAESSPCCAFVSLCVLGTFV